MQQHRRCTRSTPAAGSGTARLGPPIAPQLIHPKAAFQRRPRDHCSEAGCAPPPWRCEGRNTAARGGLRRFPPMWRFAVWPVAMSASRVRGWGGGDRLCNGRLRRVLLRSTVPLQPGSGLLPKERGRPGRGAASYAVRAEQGTSEHGVRSIAQYSHLTSTYRPNNPSRGTLQRNFIEPTARARHGARAGRPASSHTILG